MDKSQDRRLIILCPIMLAISIAGLWFAYWLVTGTMPAVTEFNGNKLPFAVPRIFDFALAVLAIPALKGIGWISRLSKDGSRYKTVSLWSLIIGFILAFSVWPLFPEFGLDFNASFIATLTLFVSVPFLSSFFVGPEHLLAVSFAYISVIAIAIGLFCGFVIGFAYALAFSPIVVFAYILSCLFRASTGK